MGIHVLSPFWLKACILKLHSNLLLCPRALSVARCMATEGCEYTQAKVDLLNYGATDLWSYTDVVDYVAKFSLPRAQLTQFIWFSVLGVKRGVSVTVQQSLAPDLQPAAVQLLQAACRRQLKVKLASLRLAKATAHRLASRRWQRRGPAWPVRSPSDREVPLHLLSHSS